MKTPEKKTSGIKSFSDLREKINTLFKQAQNKFLVFLFFLALSTLAWFIRALSDTYDAEIKYPVRYINLPPNKILSQPPPEKLMLTVRSDGYTILSTKLIFKPPLSYNVNAFSMYSLTMDSTSVYTLTRYARERLSAELNKKKKNIEIIDITPDTLFFNFSRVKKRKIPVSASIINPHAIYAQQHMLNGKIYTSPDSIVVTGPAAIVDTLRFIPTRSLRLKELSDTTEKKILIQKHPKLIYPLSKVKVIIPVDEFTESEFTVNLIQKNVPDSVLLKTFPKTVKIKYIVTLSNFEKVSSDMFKPYIDYNDIDIEMNSKATIKMDSLPPYIHSVHLTPGSAEFLIERKYVEDRNNRGNR
ncbi:MAG: hypothetical protein JXB24_00385 [Bacteroidales bacterium]|nr:hypothetical protein [Bacteroidales bacterium]